MSRRILGVRQASDSRLVLQAAWRNSCFGSLSDSVSQELQRVSTVETVGPWRAIPVHGDSTDCFIIAAGLVRVYDIGCGGHRQATVNYLAEGDTVGLPAVFATRAVGAAETVTAATLIRLPGERLRQLARVDAGVAFALLEYVAKLFLKVAETMGPTIFMS